MSENYYHGTCDTTFAPRVEHMPAREVFPEYFRVHLNPETILFLSRQQLVQLHDAIRAGYVPETRNASVAEPFRGILNRICPSPESDIEERRRLA